ncbi:MAG TPA: hypothetical protein VFA89_20440 [Terriglobales bacterium]|nr:hypothetical protein [Terriglobales bacterium]
MAQKSAVWGESLGQSKQNFVIAYILLVGVPIVALLLVLKVGRTIAAPLSVDGTWKVQAEPLDEAANSACLKALESADTLSISQSGKGLTLALNGGTSSTSSGNIEGTSISGTLRAPSSNGSCGGSGTLILAANVDANADPRSLMGTFTVDGCANCAALRFRAVRQGGNSKGARR